MKNYGIDKKIKSENRIYYCAKSRSWIRSVVPSRNRKLFSDIYEHSFVRDSGVRYRQNNGIPVDYFLTLGYLSFLI